MKIALTFFLLSLLCLASCKKGNNPPTLLNHSVDITIVNSQSKNLLDSGINKDSINIYNIVNGQQELYYKSNLDDPKGFRIIKGTDGHNYMRLILTETNDDYAIIKISLGSSYSGIMKVYYYRDKTNVIVPYKIWYNDELKYDFNDRSGLQFTIVK